MCLEDIAKLFRKLVYRSVQILPDGFSSDDYVDALEFFEVIDCNDGYISKWCKPKVSVSLHRPFRVWERTFWGKIIEAFNSVTAAVQYELVGADVDADIRVHCIRNEAEYQVYRELYGFWYKEWTNHCYTFNYYGEIYRSVICMLDNGDSNLQEAVTLHELFHGLGFPHVQNGNNRKYSIVGSPLHLNPHGLSSADLLAYKMLYDPAIKAGVTFKELKSYYDTVGITHLL